MHHVRFVTAETEATPACSLCSAQNRPWDKIATKTYCPHCMESLAVGEAEPLIVRTEGRRCAVCHQQGTLRYLTHPLHSSKPVEIDLCGEHLRALIARRLGPHAFAQLRRQLVTLGLNVSQIFLLHEAFYDSFGRSLQPAIDLS